ncbi:5'-methylthioadenosine/adenosylhomocysteine nucleosidase [Facklamia miroungae]|uniref:5'-methylthioadenosine/S-adenosylhomocysteine nucleosidase n=1 Tax=Facklamia miroungae TaxID=120956 RepID=A0A1G7TVL1_9LACT|nr:5'-methylthioadenosine/adenosylhomocysteine nucleosidase [Facklamia miroungae]NKZ29981.1 5'-methylthioadenosine/adenosylhomocysteine nucleosidase [Facklamia miroungae]SDG39064.1 adenosylhomocysteine nucleosidase [Facklamia miroungae]
MKKIGIIGAMEEEIRLLKAEMVNAEPIEYHGFVFYQGVLNEQEVVLVQSGIGKVNASVSVVLLVEHFSVDLIINTGSAGGLAPELKVGDLVIADGLIHHDVNLLAFGYEKGQMAGMPTIYQPDETKSQLAYQLANQKGQPVTIGLIASGDQFISDSQQIKKIIQAFPEVKAVEMESAAIAQAAYVLSTPFIIIRSISDKADESASMSFDEFILLAGRQSAELVLDILAHFD